MVVAAVAGVVPSFFLLTIDTRRAPFGTAFLAEVVMAADFDAISLIFAACSGGAAVVAAVGLTSGIGLEDMVGLVCWVCRSYCNFLASSALAAALSFALSSACNASILKKLLTFDTDGEVNPYSVDAIDVVACSCNSEAFLAKSANDDPHMVAVFLVFCNLAFALSKSFPSFSLSLSLFLILRIRNPSKENSLFVRTFKLLCQIVNLSSLLISSLFLLLVPFRHRPSSSCLRAYRVHFLFDVLHQHDKSNP